MVPEGEKMRTVWNPGREWLEQRYITEGKILSEIASEAGVSALTVQRAMKACGIQRRTHSNRITKRGALNGNWKTDGASYSALHKRIYKILGKEIGIKHAKLCAN